MRVKCQSCCARCSKNGTYSDPANVPSGRGTNRLNRWKTGRPGENGTSGNPKWKRWKLPSSYSTTSLSFDVPPEEFPRISACKLPDISRKKLIDLHFCRWWYGSIFITFDAIRPIFKSRTLWLSLKELARKPSLTWNSHQVHSRSFILQLVTLQPAADCLSPYNNVGLNSKYQNRRKLPSSTTYRTVVWRQLPEDANICIICTLYF